MSNDRDRDDKVSAVYRTLASERAPEYLDQKILDMAANNGKRPSYSRWMAWSRPLAWAATVTLCLAITLELVREPAVQPPVVTAPAEQAESKVRNNELIDVRREDSATALEKDSQAARKAADANRSLAAPAPQQEATASAAKLGAAEKSGLVQMRSSAKAGPAAPAAEDLDTSYAPGEEVSAFASEPELSVPACPKEHRETADSWYKCILDLQAAGENAVAAREWDKLKDTFPDFNRP